ncbi:transposase [Xanthomonas arboricola]|uniref:transposase n=1 Tax=Xanthomonas arboricola TaxID=56448 RepID=UPI001E5AA8F0|nr:transposase [Xanthomonas arboricola]
MVRLARIDLAGIPQHIVQRGNNRLPCFLDNGDRLRYLHLLHEALHATGCQLHAYVLMNNHVHFACDATCNRTDRAADAAAWAQLSGAIQWPPRPHRYAMGRALQSSSCRQC